MPRAGGAIDFIAGTRVGPNCHTLCGNPHLAWWGHLETYRPACKALEPSRPRDDRETEPDFGTSGQRAVRAWNSRPRPTACPQNARPRPGWPPTRSPEAMDAPEPPAGAYTAFWVSEIFEQPTGRIDVDDELNPRISLAVLLTLELTDVEAVREALAQVPGVKVVLSKVAPRGTLWIREGSR